MGKLYSLGEALIDFIPSASGTALKDVPGFEPKPGGAPANVAASYAKLGGKAYFVGMLGQDAFGEKLVESISDAGVETDYIFRTDQAKTGLAFVSLDATGNRDFMFYRDPSADMLLKPEDVAHIAVDKTDILHFCSVDLVDAPVRETHYYLVDKFLQQDGVLSFDPNVRLPLWKNHDELRAIIHEFVPKCHLLKVSDEELFFITGIEDEKEAIQSLFKGNVKAILYSKGPQGAQLYTKAFMIDHSGYKVDAVDTTGAGDAFVGSALSYIDRHSVRLESIDKDTAFAILDYACAVGAIVASRPGALMSMPTPEEVAVFLNEKA